MSKYLLLIFFVFLGLSNYGQTYNNEWINYNNTYYKFKVGSNGLYHITQPVLSAIGLGATPVQNFQLWKNGQEVPVYTSIASGTFSPADYIEFYGTINDGKADKPLYQYDSLQICDKWSLYTDTAAFYLTVNAGSNKRISQVANNVSGNQLPADPYFIHKLANYYKYSMNLGYGVDYGEVIYSSSYESGEGWCSGEFGSGYYYPDNNSNLYLYAFGPNASLTGAAAGNTANSRSIEVNLNGTQVSNNSVNGYDINRFTNNSIPPSLISGDVANLTFDFNGLANDRIVISYYELNYPRQYNFGGQSQFYFEIPASGAKYLAIKNFAFGVSAPVLFDLANNLRLTGVTNLDTVKFVLPLSGLTRRLILLNTEPASVKNVSSLQSRTFINYALPANQGNYLIISNSYLYNDGAGNDNVEQYRQYRSSAAGGGYTAKTIDIDQLIDQFAFGIKHHPASIRNFASYVLANYASAPKYFYLIGKGLNYSEFRNHESDHNVNKMALIPTFGIPASDNLLTASRTGEVTRIPIGRLSAISGVEVKDYLDKVKQFELAYSGNPQNVAGKGWMKNIVQVTGGTDDPSLYSLLTSYMQGYSTLLRDTLFGAKVYDFSKNSGQYTATGSNKTMDNLFSEGMSMLTYFGHSSPNTLEFNLDDPQNYNNTGKYPLINVNGCNAGDLFLFDTLRSVSKGTLSEKYVFSQQKGSIGFIASTHLGLPQQLNNFTNEFNRNMAGPMYGMGIGDIMKSTMQSIINNYGYDFASRLHAEEITYHGDPALKLNPQNKPDYTIVDSLISFSPNPISIADEKVLITAKILNIGKAIKDSLTIRIQQQLPDNSLITLSTRRIVATLYEDTIQYLLTINPLIHKGVNQLIVTIDPNNLIPELSESNNSVTKSFTIADNDIRPVYPYNYAIIGNSANFGLYGSTANPLAITNPYVMEMDTTRNFNSSLKVTKTVYSKGGVVKFTPGITMIDSTVYYWRLAVGPVGANTNWSYNSFIYINGSPDGFNQSHYFQFKDDNFTNYNLDSTSRLFNFGDKTRKLLIRTGIYPYYNWDQSNVNVDNDQVEFWGCFWGLHFYVFDSLSLVPWNNISSPTFGTPGRFGSMWVCVSPRRFFEYDLTQQTQRQNAMNFFDSIPNGMYVAIRNKMQSGNTTFIDQWKADTAQFGSGVSLWHKFHQMGLHSIDSFTSNKAFNIVFKKNGNVNGSASEIRQYFGSTSTEQRIDTFLINGKSTTGIMETPWLGPAKAWYNFKWDETIIPGSTNQKYFDIVGKTPSGTEVVLSSVYNSHDTTVSFISAAQFPYLKLRLNASDPMLAKAVQLKYWMLTASKQPEGAIAPNIVFQFQDTLMSNDTLKMKVLFKNISNTPFDSLKATLTVTDKNGVPHVYGNAPRQRPLLINDSLVITFNVPASSYAGANQVLLDVNPGNDQPEQFHFNNTLYKSLYVVSSLCPGSSTSFSAGSATAGNIYQWQLNSGAGYTNLLNGGIYSGVTSNNLNLSLPPTNLYGYKYRCQITNGLNITFGPEYVLKFTITWQGTVNNAWETIGNWGCAILPDSYTDVIINGSSPNYPTVNSNAKCHSLKMKPGTSVIVTNGRNLSITGTGGY